MTDTSRASSSPSSTPGAVVKFMSPNACRVDLSFFETLYEMKLNEMKLAVDDVSVSAFRDTRGGAMVLRAESLRGSPSAGVEVEDGGESLPPVPSSVYSRGVLKNVNTTNVSIIHQLYQRCLCV